MSYYNGVRIFVVDEGLDGEQIIARLQPLDGGTVNQVFGYVSPILKLSCYVVGKSDEEDLRNSTATGSSHLLVYDTISGDYFLQKMSSKNVRSVRQTIRYDLPVDSPVYLCELILLEDS